MFYLLYKKNIPILLYEEDEIKKTLNKSDG